MITTDRNEFTGTHLTKDAKEALREEAEREADKRGGRVSMSRLVAEWVTEKLKQRGHSIKEVA